MNPKGHITDAGPRAPPPEEPQESAVSKISSTRVWRAHFEKSFEPYFYLIPTDPQIWSTI